MLGGGDSNKKYFHTSATARKKSNLVERLVNDEGVVLDSQADLCALAQDYFNLLFANHPNDVDRVAAEIPSKISDEDNAQLLAPFTMEEFRKATFLMHPVL